PVASPGGQHGQTRRLKFLLAFKQARDARLGEIQLVRDSDLFFRGLHGPEPTTQGKAEGRKSYRASHRRVCHPRNAGKSNQVACVFREAEGNQGPRRRGDSACNLARQLRLPAPGRKAGTHGRLPDERTGNGESRSRSEWLECRIGGRGGNFSHDRRWSV